MSAGSPPTEAPSSLFDRIDSGFARLGAVVMAIGCWMLALIVPLIVLGVVVGALRLPLFVPMDWAPLLLRQGLTLNGVFELQWHLFTAAVMFAIAPLWLADGHIRADFLRQRLSRRSSRMIDIVGHVVFGLPFVLLLVVPAYTFAMSAFTSGEGSLDFGLTDRFLVKFAIAGGFALAALAGLFVLIRDVRGLWVPDVERRDD